MRDRTTKPDRRNVTNARPATCEHCGFSLAPGKGFVWWCSPENGVCENADHAEKGGAHIRCKDSKACHGRAKKAMGKSSKRTRLAKPVDGPPHDSPARAPNACGESRNVDAATPPAAPASVALDTFQGPPRDIDEDDDEDVAGFVPTRCPLCKTERRSLLSETRHTSTGLDTFHCQACHRSFDVWRCCGFLDDRVKTPSRVYREFAICPRCGKSRFGTPVEYRPLEGGVVFGVTSAIE